MYIIISVIYCYIVVFSILYILLKPNNFYTARQLKFYMVLLEFIMLTNICY